MTVKPEYGNAKEKMTKIFKILCCKTHPVVGRKRTSVLTVCGKETQISSILYY